MSTREIAELTGKRHDNVLADFRDMCEALELGLLSFQDTYIHQQNGQTYIHYVLPKDLTTTLVSGYSIPMRHKIVQRWMELEAVKPAFEIPTTLVEALRLALEGAEKLEVTEFHSKNPRPYLEYSPRSIPPCPPLDFSRITRGGAGLVLG